MNETGKQLVHVQKNSLSIVKKQLDITERILKERALALPTEKADSQTGFADPVTGMEFVYVKGGTFIMGDTFGDGDDDELPTHQVTVSDFYIGRYPVTQGEWESVMGSNPSYFYDAGATCPVEQVSWDDIQIFISKLNQRSNKNYRLPTEAEWEYAARSGGKNEKYSGSNDISAVAWYYENSDGTTHPVGQKQANGFGLYDMSGNVWEWVNDWYGSYSCDSQTNPAGPLAGSSGITRGGNWGADAYNVRVAFRNNYFPSCGRPTFIGFRLVAPVQSLTLSAEKADVTTDVVSVTVAETELAESLIYTDTQTGLMWPLNGNIAGREMSWDDAMSWVKNLNYAGFSDWRLPTKDELETFAERGGRTPSAWFNDNGFNNVQSHHYWSTCPYQPYDAWHVDLSDSYAENGFGESFIYYDGCYYVWTVRGGQCHSVNYGEPQAFYDDDESF